MTDSHISTLQPGRYEADPVHSQVSFEVKHLGIAPFRASFGEIKASLDVRENGLTFHGTVPVQSIAITQPDFRAHLLSPEFFDADNYPSIVFASTSLSRTADGAAVLEGEIEIRGQRRLIRAEGVIADPMTGMGDTPVVAAHFEAVLDRNDFGLGWNMDLPGGRKVVGDEVRLIVSLELVAAR